MSDPIPAEVRWLIHKVHGTAFPVAFVRAHKGGAYVFGGPSGSHLTGHRESWREKWDLLEKEGYVSLEVAHKLGLIPPDWRPPDDLANKDSVITMIREGAL
jgi:hypothetical protein